jgi:hypothetical protein
VDPVQLVRPGDPVLRDHPFPAPDMGDLLGLGELAVGRRELGGPLPDLSLQLGRGPLELLVGVEPLGDHGGEEERAEGDRGVERLEGEHLLEQRPGVEGPGALGRRPRRHHHHEQGRRRRPPLPEPPGRPSQQRDDQEHQVGVGPDRHHRHRGREDEQDRGLQVPPAWPARPGPRRGEAEGERGDHEDAHGVARPPHRPGARQLVRPQEAGRRQDPGADRGADAHAQQRAHEHERRRVPQAVDLPVQADPGEQGRGHQRSDRVAGGRRRGGQPAGADREVDHEGGQGHAGPDRPPEQQERRHGDARRGPERGDVPFDQRQLQAELGGGVVGGRHQQHAGRRGPGGCRGGGPAVWESRMRFPVGHARPF